MCYSLLLFSHKSAHSGKLPPASRGAGLALLSRDPPQPPALPWCPLRVCSGRVRAPSDVAVSQGTAWTLAAADSPSGAVPFGGAHGHCRPVVKATCLPLGLNLRQGRPLGFLARAGSSSPAHVQGCGTPLSLGFAVDVTVGWGGPQLPSCKMA